MLTDRLGGRRRRASGMFAAFALLAAPGVAGAQTDYYNTDSGRPVTVEDASPVERYAFEAQVAPLRLERSDEGEYQWEFEPELAYGFLPRTHIEVGLPLQFTEIGEGARELRLAGVHLSLFHNLNVETRTLPAFAVGTSALIPVGSSAPDDLYASVKGIATRTFSFARFHVNSEYTFGPEQRALSADFGDIHPNPEAAAQVEGELEDVGEATRWSAGLAIDKTYPLRAALLIADVLVEQPLNETEDLRWTIEAGTRYQLDPEFAIDLGVGRTLTGDEQGWFFTFGAARVFAIRSLIPVRRP